MRDASDQHDRQGFTCTVCGRFITTTIDGLFTNAAVGSPRRFCSPSCRQAAYRRRRTRVDETTPLQHHGGRRRRLTANNPPEPAPESTTHP